MSILIWLLTFVLILLSVFLVLIVLAQKSKSDGGVGAALGGGMTEATFGADTGNVLATLTRNGTIVFFVLTFALFLAHISRHKANRAEGALPVIAAPAAPDTPVAVPATSTEAPAESMEATPTVTVPVVADTAPEAAISLPAVSAPAPVETAPAPVPAAAEPAK